MSLKDYQKKGVLPRSMWTDSKYDATTYGTKLLKKIIGNNEFSYPKSLNAVNRINQQTVFFRKFIIYFANIIID